MGFLYGLGKVGRDCHLDHFSAHGLRLDIMSYTKREVFSLVSAVVASRRVFNGGKRYLIFLNFLAGLSLILS